VFHAFGSRGADARAPALGEAERFLAGSRRTGVERGLPDRRRHHPLVIRETIVDQRTDDPFSIDSAPDAQTAPTVAVDCSFTQRSSP